jgi:hypothetical protein
MSMKIVFQQKENFKKFIEWLKLEEFLTLSLTHLGALIFGCVIVFVGLYRALSQFNELIYQVIIESSLTFSGFSIAVAALTANEEKAQFVKIARYFILSVAFMLNNLFIGGFARSLINPNPNQFTIFIIFFSLGALGVILFTYNLIVLVIVLLKWRYTIITKDYDC